MPVARILSQPLLEASGLSPGEWYPILEPGAELASPPLGFAWVLVRDRPRLIWGGHLEIRPRVLALAPCCRRKS